VTNMRAEHLDDNKAIVRAYVETVWNRRQLERAEEVVAPDFR
jgi:hypothetical protein